MGLHEAGRALAHRCTTYGSSWKSYQTRQRSLLLRSTSLALSGNCAAVVTGFILGRVPTSYIMNLAMLAFTVGTDVVASMLDWAQLFVSFLVTPWRMDMSFLLIISSSMSKEYQESAAPW